MDRNMPVDNPGAATLAAQETGATAAFMGEVQLARGSGRSHNGNHQHHSDSGIPTNPQCHMRSADPFCWAKVGKADIEISARAEWGNGSDPPSVCRLLPNDGSAARRCSPAQIRVMQQYLANGSAYRAPESPLF
jgi:hypothetical protein